MDRRRSSIHSFCGNRIDKLKIMSIKQIMSRHDAATAAVAKTHTPGSGQPVQNFPDKVVQPKAVPAPPTPQQLSFTTGLAYDFQSGEYNSNFGVGAWTRTGDVGIKLSVPAILKKRKIYFGFYPSNNGNNTWIAGNILMWKNNSIVGKLPFGYVNDANTTVTATTPCVCRGLFSGYNWQNIAAYFQLVATSIPGTILNGYADNDDSIQIYIGTPQNGDTNPNLVGYDILYPKRLNVDIDY